MNNMDNNYIYYTNIDNLSDDLFNHFLSKVSKYRYDKTIKYRNINDKKLSLCSELLLRRAFEDFNIDSSYIFLFNENNKPCLGDIDIKFNISHSGNYVVCAISLDEVGVDIEEIRDIKHDIAKNFFSLDENSHLSSISDETYKKETFYRLWTLKESFIKNIGTGLYLPLKDFSIILDDEISIKQSFDNNNYYFEEFSIDPSYKCSLCKMNKKSTLVKWIDVFDLTK